MECKPVTLHVYPLNDLREHIIEGTECWCSPEIDDHGYVVHNSLDQRETYEQGRKAQ